MPMWWGYKHKNGKIQVKRWYPPLVDCEYLGDLEFCKKEAGQPNSFVKAIVPYPFDAETRIEAMRIVSIYLDDSLQKPANRRFLELEFRDEED